MVYVHNVGRVQQVGGWGGDSRALYLDQDCLIVPSMDLLVPLSSVSTLIFIIFCYWLSEEGSCA